MKPMGKQGTVAGETSCVLEDMHRDCFACGVSNPVGLNLHFVVGEDGIAVAVWMPSPNFRSYPDRVHCGIFATLLDSAIVHALFAGGLRALRGTSGSATGKK